MSDAFYESRTEKTVTVEPPMGLTEWAEETRRMLADVYPSDIFVRDADSAEPGCRMLFHVEAALDRYYDIRAEARK